MRNLKKFATLSEYESYIGGSDAILPNVSICEDTPNFVGYNPYIPPPPVKALKFTATGASTLGLTNNSGNAPVLEKSSDGESWSSWDYSTISLADGESVYIRGNNPSGFSSSSKYSKFTMTGSIACKGNVMHLLSYEEDLATIPCNSCYSDMFSGCKSLTTAPELPATTLASSCYSYMFYDCSSLTTAPELPATTLANYCYSRMFSRCSVLNNIIMLATNISASSCLNDWVSGVSSTGTFTKKTGVSIPSGTSGIPSGWTVVEV